WFPLEGFGRRVVPFGDVNRNQPSKSARARDPHASRGSLTLISTACGRGFFPRSCGSAAVAPAVDRRRGLLDLGEELDVARGLLQPLEQQLEGLLAVEPREHPPELPDDGELLPAHQELL